MFQSIRDLENNTFILFNLDFAIDIILLCFLFLTIDLYFLVPAINSQIFNPISEPVIPKGIQIKEVKAEVETYLVILEAKTRNCSI